MSTYYYVACDACRLYVPLWGVWAGSHGPLRTAVEHPESVTDFLIRHAGHGHGCRVLTEHAEAIGQYRCTVGPNGEYPHDEPSVE